MQVRLMHRWFTRTIATPSLLFGFSMALEVASARAELPPMIPRSVLFQDPAADSPRLSPDGRRLAYLSNEAGVMNIRVRDLSGGNDSLWTHDEERGIWNLTWAADGRYLLYKQDQHGDENEHVFSLDLTTGIVRDLTPFLGVKAKELFSDKSHPNELLVELNLRDRTVFDLHRIDLTTGAVHIDTENPGDVISWIPDAQFEARGAVALDPTTGDTILRLRGTRSDPWREFQRWSFEEAGSDLWTRIVAFSPDGRELLLQSPIGSDTMRLVRVDAETGEIRQVVAENTASDLWNPFAGEQLSAAILLGSDGWTVEAVGWDRGIPEWQPLRPEAARDFEALARAHAGVPFVVDQSADGTRWIVLFYDDRNPGVYSLYDRTDQRSTFLFDSAPHLAGLALARTEAFTFQARDGMSIHGYLTLPVGVAPKNLPLVLTPHGGPWLRDDWGYDGQNQWLANRGYACLQVNFRGSAGFGKSYLNAGNHEMGTGHMQHDLSDAVAWAIEQGIADPKRVAIFGGSYGGYATYAGLSFTPDLYACGVAYVGPSNLKTLIESFPDYWAPRRRRWLLRIGDVLHDEALNQRISPLFHVDEIRAPMLIAHGAHDPRVKQVESDRIVAALREHKIDVTYIVYPDEGHGFGRPENNQDFFGRVETFLAAQLSGRAEPWNEVHGSSAEVR